MCVWIQDLRLHAHPNSIITIKSAHSNSPTYTGVGPTKIPGYESSGTNIIKTERLTNDKMAQNLNPLLRYAPVNVNGI